MFLSIRHRQARVLTPSMFMAHEPQIPSRHDRRNVSVGSTSFLILMSASSTGERGRMADGVRAWSGQPQGLPRENRRRRKAQAKDSLMGPVSDRSRSYVCILGFSEGLSGFYIAGQAGREERGRSSALLLGGRRPFASSALAAFSIELQLPLRPICPQGLLCSNRSQRESRGQETSQRTHPSVDRELLDDLLLGGSSFRGVGLGGLSLGEDGRGGERSGDGGCSDGLGGGAAKGEHDREERDGRGREKE